jgi:hypothetical protein
MIRKFILSLEETRTEKKKVIFLEVLSAVSLGLVAGMLISPRKNVMIGSKNEGNGCNNTSCVKAEKEKCKKSNSEKKNKKGITRTEKI